MKHWAYDLVGAPYRVGASGPEEFDCLGLVRYYFKTHHGIDLPAYELAAADPVGLRRFVRATGWRRVRAGEKPADEDVLLCRNFVGRHIGLVVQTNAGLGLLHAEGNEKRGSVFWQHLDTLVAYREKELWRRAC